MKPMTFKKTICLLLALLTLAPSGLIGIGGQAMAFAPPSIFIDFMDETLEIVGDELVFTMGIQFQSYNEHSAQIYGSLHDPDGLPIAEIPYGMEEIVFPFDTSDLPPNEIAYYIGKMYGAREQ